MLNLVLWQCRVQAAQEGLVASVPLLTWDHSHSPVLRWSEHSGISRVAPFCPMACEDARSKYRCGIGRGLLIHHQPSSFSTYKIVCRETEEIIKIEVLEICFLKYYVMTRKYNYKFSKVNALRREGESFPLFSFCLFVWLLSFERQNRESTSRGGAEREGEGGSEVGSAATAKSPRWDFLRSWAKLKSDA